MRPVPSNGGPLLSRTELAALVVVADGEDVLSADLATCLRALATKRPDLVVLSEPVLEREVDEARAFFHAAATEKGRSYFFQRTEVRS